MVIEGHPLTLCTSNSVGRMARCQRVRHRFESGLVLILAVEVNLKWLSCRDRRAGAHVQMSKSMTPVSCDTGFRARVAQLVEHVLGVDCEPKTIYYCSIKWRVR